MDQTGRCIFCGTSRARTVPTCPACGRGWIDTPVASPAAGPLPAAGGGIPEPDFSAISQVGSAIPIMTAESEAFITQEFLPERRNPLRVVFSIVAGLVAVALVGAISIAAIRRFVDASSEALPPPSTTIAPVTSIPGDGTDTVTTTTEPPVTTTSTTTVPVPEIPAVGEAIAASELQLGAFAMGPIDFGDAAADSLGRLVATFGQPDGFDTGDGVLGLCPDESGSVYSWAGLSVVVADESSSIEGYRLDAGPDHPTARLATISGLRVGATVSDLQTLYSSFTIRFEAIEDSVVFLLIRSTDDVLLLWGPVTSSEPDGLIEGIYAPNPCDGGYG